MDFCLSGSAYRRMAPFSNDERVLSLSLKITNWQLKYFAEEINHDEISWEMSLDCLLF